MVGYCGQCMQRVIVAGRSLLFAIVLCSREATSGPSALVAVVVAVVTHSLAGLLTCH